MGRKDIRRMGATLAVLSLPLGCGGDGDGGMVQPGPVALSVSRVGGNGQTAGTGGEVPSPLVVRVSREDGGTVAGASVTWAVSESPGDDAELVDTESETDARGRASTGLIVGSTPGSYRVTATVPDGSSVEFSATAVERVFGGLAAVGGDGQSGEVGQEVEDSLVARSLDQFDDPIGGVSVAFEVSRGASAGSEVAPSTVETDASGRAAASLVLGEKNGTYRVRAAAGDDTVGFSATASGGTESLLSLEEVTPATLEAGGRATLVGAGFAASATGNEVTVDGRRAEVVSATETELTVTVPTYEDRCLPRRDVEVRVVVSPDTSQAVVRELTPAVPELGLAAGEDSVLVGSDRVDCLMLPGAAAGEAEYELIVTPMDTALGTSSMRLFVNGRPAPSAETATAPPPALGKRGGAPLRAEGGAGLEPWRRAQYAWDRRLRERELGWLPEIRARAARAPSMSRTVGSLSPATAAVGDTATFGVSCTSEDDVFAEVRARSDAAVIYEDTVMRSRGVGLGAAQYDSIAARFDTVSFAVDTLYFGAPRDIDENGRILMLFTPAVNRVDGNYDDGFIVGFFCGFDLMPDLGNEAEMFYLVSPDPDGSFTSGDDGSLPKAFIRGIIEGTVVHELQHLINAQIGGGSAPDEPSGGGAQETWLNEGMSHLAEEVAGHAVTGHRPGTGLTAAELTADPDALSQFYRANFRNLAAYLSRPASVEGLLSSRAGFETRGAAWSFARYLLDRFMSPSGEHDLTRALIRSPEPGARAAVEDAVESAAGADGIGFEEIAVDWSAMFAVDDRPDLAVAPRPSLDLSSYRLRDVYADETFGSDGAYPLVPTEVDLHAVSEVSAELFTGTARYVRLRASSASTGTGLKLGTIAGEDLPASVSPRLLIVRTR